MPLSGEGFTAAEIESIYGGSFIGGNRVELLYRGREAFNRIFGAIGQAREIVCLEFYIFRNDETGEELAGLLKRKASEGVKVYLLYDHLGSFGTPRSFWAGLREAGIRVRASHPFIWTSPRRYQHRDHRKLVIVDGRTAFTGGLNIANEYRGLHLRKKEPWRDTGVIIEGPAAAALMETFVRAWRTWTRKEISHGPVEAAPEGDLRVMPIFAHSSRGRRRMRRLLYYSINHAAESIYLTTAYFTPSWRMVETLEEAVKRGVTVRLLVPGRSDQPAAYYAGRAFFKRLIDAGVEIYEYQGMVLHAKAYVFDRVWSIAGSANLDFQSLRWNDEGNVGILDEGFAARMTAMFDEDLKSSERIIREDWARRPLLERAKERFFSLFRRRL
jgi:cardiolipin synthase